jgi:hypothetical protein
MRAAGLRLGLATACAMLASGCTQPQGIMRRADIPGSIDPACAARAMRTMAGLKDVVVVGKADRPELSTPEVIDWVWIRYAAPGLTDALPVAFVNLHVDVLRDPATVSIKHQFNRDNDRGATEAKVRSALNVMKRVEAGVAAACAINFAERIEMECAHDLKCEAAA